MSYEGYAQCICKNGHYFTIDSMGEDQCPDCDETSEWYNNVDDTNCDSYGEIPYELLVKNYLISEARHEICSLGHNHRLSPEIFRVPTQEETAGLRHHRPHYGRTPLIPIPSR